MDGENHQSSERYEQRLQQLKGATYSRLPADYIRPSPLKLVEASLNEPIPSNIKNVLERLAAALPGSRRSRNDKVSAVILTAFAILIQRLSGDESICIGTNVFTGPWDEYSSCSRQYPARLDFQASTDSFESVYNQFTRVAEDCSSKLVPISDLLSFMQKRLPQDTRPNALFHTGLFHSTLSQDPSTESLLASNGLETDITIDLLHTPSKDLIQIQYNALVFSSKRIEILRDQLYALLVSALEHPDLAAGKLSLLTPSQQSEIPDVRANLGWCDFRGAIHDIFMENAKKFPERECVVETMPDNSMKPRSFTYGQINAASNILAHHLIRKGVKKNDVVMAYAYRGVDLVVSVMGILKAGATFSVVDPQYPPNRQIIYLEVSKPRALISIAKAGSISPTVHEFTESKLDLLARIPSLELQDDGSLTGGRIDDEDVIAPDQTSANKDPEVVVGPDDHPTLSFTSGSEGVPKGVKGRHFSLAYYFDWMAERFNLSEDDKFTMLSGIAHDPIQRDIFTPLFLGAKLIVPPVDDITPGRLAQWAQRNAVTVTHLTPAMGQLLTGQATCEIPSLHHAFFVGDILTKRDCLQLQRLGRNVAVVNMYGTTETQRAVSYYEVPSLATDASFLDNQKDVISAGKGMYNVQLLVINRNDPQKVCGIGEIGEIYVRAGGLAEGYLGHDELTKSKFVNSWFVPHDYWEDTVSADAPWKSSWKGPRDRLYRSGDLGRYTPDGNVECSGRADDQVKIRGFRIELGEINTYLGQHHLVRENITLVKRNKDEEPTLVSYIVPRQDKALLDYMSSEEDQKSDDGMVRNLRVYRKLLKELQNYLRTKVPSYAVPSVIVPLNKMPLNPNGKIDKPALPFPDTVQLAASSKKSTADAGELTASEKQLSDLWLKVLPIMPSGLSKFDDFFEVGGHSLVAARLMIELQKELALDVPMSLILSQPATLERMARSIDELKRGTEVTTELDGPDRHKLNGEREKSYSEDAAELIASLPETLPSRQGDVAPGDETTVFVTGVTGFLGVYLLKELMERDDKIKVHAHVRASTEQQGFDRLRNACDAFGLWNDDWTPRLRVVKGNLNEENLGLSKSDWDTVVQSADIVIHNGARVHWLDSYFQLRPTNVVATLSAIELCAQGKKKLFTFVSSTSVVDNDHYVNLSQDLMEKAGTGIPESDDLQGSASELGTGYGQSKWSSEAICRAAGSRGLRGSIVRPGYILGHSQSGVTNTDDFLIRMLKGCIELKQAPLIENTVNMVPVDHVARLVAAASFNPLPSFGVIHVTSHPRMRLNQFLESLCLFGYQVHVVDYLHWKKTLKQHVFEEARDSALLPLLSFVQENLPSNTKAPELDDRNACAVLRADKKWTREDLSSGKAVGTDELKQYLSYLVGIEFIPKPSQPGELSIGELSNLAQIKEKITAIGGRGSQR